MVGVIGRRISSIKVILSWWSKGNITSAINALGMMNDISIVTDVINATFANNIKIELLTYDNLI